MIEVYRMLVCQCIMDSVKIIAANPFARNDDCQTPLDVARTKGHANVVHAIEVLYLE